ncbi:MAG: hypothetical protein ACI4RS_04800 [Monoglobaceae bacterium]
MKDEIYIPVDLPPFIIKIKNKQCATEVLTGINNIIENTVKRKTNTLLISKYEAIKASLLDVINDNIY